MAQANWRQPLQDFQAWIWRERVTGSQDDYTAGLEDFIPAGEVAAYLRQPGKLTGILTALFGDNRDHIDPRQLLNRYSVVFAILVSIDHGQYIGNFTPHDALCDARLPFTERPKRFPLDQGSSNLFYERFATAQARFCAPKFTEGHCEFEAEERLPFLEKEFIDDGGSAKVYRVKLHAEHDLIHRPQSSVASASTEGQIVLQLTLLSLSRRNATGSTPSRLILAKMGRDGTVSRPQPSGS